MTILATEESQVRTALETCVSSLNKLAANQLESALQQRLDELGARKEFLGPAEHDELLALVELSQRRTIEALEAQLAWKRFRDAFLDAGVIP